jgi:predicted pyridoxine 5'-phosphate oxidase superfamily flavin-nucleotide-binding protein
MIPESIRALVSTGPLAHLTTLNSDGSPQVTVVWVRIEDDEFVTARLDEHRKIKNICNDGRVALSFLGKGRNPLGLLEYVVAYRRRPCGVGPDSSNVSGQIASAG